MACTCIWTYEKQGDATIGYREECQECKDNAVIEAEKKAKEEIRNSAIEEIKRLEALKPRLLTDIALGKGDEIVIIRDKNTTALQELQDIENQMDAQREIIGLNS